jgi:hypothetical protein
MPEPTFIFFNMFVVAAFLSSALDHYFVGQGRVIRPLRAFLLGCFVFTETYLAIDNPVLWLYVSLNFWGLGNLFFGRRFAPLLRRRRK